MRSTHRAPLGATTPTGWTSRVGAAVALAALAVIAVGAITAEGDTPAAATTPTAFSSAASLPVSGVAADAVHTEHGGLFSPWHRPFVTDVVAGRTANKWRRTYGLPPVSSNTATAGGDNRVANVAQVKERGDGQPQGGKHPAKPVRQRGDGQPQSGKHPVTPIRQKGDGQPHLS